jgi:hypothetical protein
VRSAARITFYAPALLLLCLFAQAMAHARSASLTFDEGPHLATGYATLRTGDLRLQPVHIHPPLANVLAAAPLLLQHDLPDPRAVEGWEIASLSAITDAVVWQYPHPRRLALAGRFPIILMTLLLAAIVFRWACDLGQISESANQRIGRSADRQIGKSGAWAGVLALFLYAFDPNVIAHGSLVTTDMAVVLWGTLAAFLTARYLQGSRKGDHKGDHKGRPYLAGAAVALGLALGSKVSALSLAPVLGLLWLLGPRGFSWRRRLLATAGGAALAALTLWAIYGFEVRPLPGLPFPLPAATHIAIYRSLQEHYALGHSAFLLGQNAEHGWWYYFPVAFALKTPLPTLVLLVVATISNLKSQIGKSANLQSAICRWAPLVLFPVVYAISAPFSSVNIGYRHLLPILPFVFIAASCITQHGTRNTWRVLRIACSVFCLAWLALGTLLVSPNYLAFFNELAGGPARGYRYLVDSNLDWGQNLWQLREWMRANGVEQVYYAHFSPARPEVYGIRADPLPPSPRAVPFAPLQPAPGVYAIGATVLQGVYTPDVNTYAWFRAHEPVARLGDALFVYRVAPRPAPAWAAVCANPAPTLSPEAVRAGLGRPDLRVALFDCTQAWVYPPGGQPGTLVLPPEAEAPPGATLQVAARHADGKPFYTVYRVEGTLTPEQAVNVSVDGPLTFLGYRVNGQDYHPGDVIELWTFWRVKEIPARPLSLMAHLTGADGVPIAVGDGLGLPIEQWRVGDVIVQRSRFPATEAMQGDYQLRAGAYWLDTLERWPMQDEEGNVSDHVELTEIGVLH